MPKIFSYLLRNLAFALLFVTLAVTAALWLAQSLRYVDVVVENGAPLHMFIYLALLTLPTFLSLTLPIAMFVAVLFTYNRLTLDSELIAMRASGMSPRTLAAPALFLALLVSLLGWGLSVWVQPVASRELVSLQYFIQSQFTAALLREGVFNSVDDDFTIYVQGREESGELAGILIHDSRNRQKPVTIRASRGHLVQTGAGPQVKVYDGLQQEFDNASHLMSELHFESYTVALDSIMKNASDRVAMPREQGTFALMRDIGTETNSVIRSRMRSELNQRLAGPPLALTFTLIATCCLLFGEYSRRGQTRRMMLAIILGVLAETTVLGFAQAVGQSNLALVPLYLASLLPVTIGGVLLWRSGQAGRIQPLKPAMATT